ncbi:protein disulfide-isomerase A3-like isoform X2 [Brienomyrus brachyistius]|uniref:protein disulfide-isomerase A3-like isoform X2 n=1 Tax=Brienomyrus brachyistius TaxID=42636 RepID=UPI0020B23149|nr:protein disulfide-isomerase A3-like isoform X2 [Brienomyrus brachyistius]XP_048857139.1 protein disulfide-isomerase A3-like isoform X2 [Brienomyrus brachyistius]
MAVVSSALIALLILSPVALGIDVLQLQNTDFDYWVSEQDMMLVKFFAPWCKKCQKLAPEYENAATRLKGIVTLAEVDCSANSGICGRFGVNGYPTLKIFRNGKEAAIYNGPHTAEGIVQYMQKQVGPSSVSLHSKADLDAFIDNFDASIVGFFPGHGSTQLTEYLKAATALRESYRFAHTTKAELGVMHDLHTETVLLFRPPRLHSTFETSMEKYDGPISTSVLRKFIKDNIFGICPHVTQENRDKLKGRDLLIAFYDLDYVRDPKGSKYWRNRVLKVASQFQSRSLTFAVANRREFQKELEQEFGLGLSDSGGPPVVTIRTREGHKYTMREEFTRDGKALERFLEDYFAGHLKRFIKSQPSPERNNGPIKVVVAETFEEIVNDPDKDVLIEFYAPSCRHCKNLEPKYVELGQKLSSNPRIIIAKMDATANDVPNGYDVQGSADFISAHMLSSFPLFTLQELGRRTCHLDMRAPVK